MNQIWTESEEPAFVLFRVCLSDCETESDSEHETFCPITGTVINAQATSVTSARCAHIGDSNSDRCWARDLVATSSENVREPAKRTRPSESAAAAEAGTCGRQQTDRSVQRDGGASEDGGGVHGDRTAPARGTEMVKRGRPSVWTWKDAMHQLIESGLTPAVRNPKVATTFQDDDNDDGIINGSAVPSTQRVKKRLKRDDSMLVLPTIETLRGYFERGHSIHGTISKLRDYQAELALSWRSMRCSRVRSCTCLPTGCGKTLAAVAMIHIMKELDPKKKAVFLAPNVPLVSQQAGYLHHWRLAPRYDAGGAQASRQVERDSPSWAAPRVAEAVGRTYRWPLHSTS